jgi:glycosyltransferase involved in cell wall biosynthesis
MKKKVLMIVYTIYPFDARVRREAETLARDKRIKVTVLTLKRNYLPEIYEIDGVYVKELNQSKYRGNSSFKYIISYFKFLWLSFLACSRAFFWHEIDIVHVHNMPNFLVFSAIFPRFFGKKLILDIHDTVPETYISKFSGNSKVLFRLFCFEERMSCALAHKIVCVNHVQREALVSRGISPDKITISMNVPDHNKYNSAKIKKWNYREGECFRIVYHGTVAQRLGIDLAIKAVSCLDDKIPGLEYYIWGEGEFVNCCKELTESLGVSNKIFFNTPVPSDVVPKILKGMDLGIISNRMDLATELMLPVKMLEYIALNIPVVVPKLKGIQYYFSDEMVAYFEPGNVDSLANAILKLYLDESKRIKQTQSARKFLEQYGWEKHQMDLINLYREL